MRPSFWHPPVELSPTEQTIITRIKRAKLFVFLRDHRHILFDDAFQEELAALYAPSFRGQPPIPLAQLALALILQAYTGVSDDEAIEVALMDRQWQLVLDCLDTEQAPWSYGTLVAFRKRLIEMHMDRRLIERTIEMASHTQDFGALALRAALDSSPLWGAGRVEDTYNLLGHALKKAIRLVAEQQERGLAEVGQKAGAALICGTSVKAALDCDWDQPGQRDEALQLMLQVLQAMATWVWTLSQEEMELAQPSLEIAQHIQAQDVQVNEKGKASQLKGVARDRRISIEDAEMRHGRKSRSVRVDGYKRHVLHDLDTGLIRAVGITPANIPEASVTKEIDADLEPQGVHLTELHIDRGYLSSHFVRDRSDELEIYCKAWPVREGKRFSKQAFTAGLWTGRLFVVQQNKRCLSSLVGWRIFPKISVSSAP